MIQQKNIFLWHKLNAIMRLFIVRGGCRIFFNNITINEYPKSGGTWIGQMVSEAINLPFPRNRLPMFRESIMHGHYYATFGMKNVLIVWRDGRDVAVSQYFHWLFENEFGGSSLVKKCRTDLGFKDYEDIYTNLPKFLDYVYVRKKHPRFSWSDFVNQWFGRNVVYVRYEDMRKQPVQELSRIISELTSRQKKTLCRGGSRKTSSHITLRKSHFIYSIFTVA